MAGEISVAASLSVTNGNVQFSRSVGGSAVDQTTAGGPAGGAVSIGITEEAKSFNDLTSEGWAIITNDDATNFVDFGFSTGVYGIRLLAGEFAMMRLKPGAVFYCLADTAACQVTFNVLDA